MATDSEEFKEILHCPICMELFEDPQILKCLHTICCDCLKQLQKSSTVKCPTCREVSSGSDIKKDFKTQNLLDLYEKAEQKRKTEKLEAQQEKAFQVQAPQVRDCQSCKKDTVTWFCRDCAKLLCSNCGESHKEMQGLAHHEVQPVESIAWEKRGKLQVVRTDILQCTSKAEREMQKFQTLQSDFQKTKYSVLKEIYNAEENAKREVEKHFENIRHSVELKSVTYLLKLGLIVMDLSEVQGVFRDFDAEIAQVIDDNNYMKIIHETENACRKIYQYIQKVNHNVTKLQLDPGIKPPEFLLCPQSLKVTVATLMPDLPEVPQVTTQQFQSMSLGVKQTASRRRRPPTKKVEEVKQKHLTPTIAPKMQPENSIPPKTSHHPVTEVLSETFATRSRLEETLSLKLFSKTNMELERTVTPRGPSDQYFHLCCIQNEIWCVQSDWFDIYNNDGEFLRQFRSETHFKSPFHALESFGGDLIIASNEGLYLFNKHEEFQRQLCNGRYVHMCLLLSLKDEVICGLDKWNKEAVAFRNRGQGNWEKIGTISLPEVDSVKDTIKGNNVHLYVCLHLQGVVCQHDISNGSLLKRIELNQLGSNLAGALQYPYLCHLDTSGWLLVCDVDNSRVILVDDQDSAIPLKFGIDIEPHLSAVDNSNKLWIYEKGRKLLRFQAVIDSPEECSQDGLSSMEKQKLIGLL